VTLTTNCNWSVTSFPAGLTVSPSSGAAGTFNLTVTAGVNSSIDSQSVVVTFSSCNGQVTQNLTVVQQGQSVGVDNPGKESCNSVVCIPNPAHESASFFIQTDQSQTVHLEILAADGRIVAAMKNLQVRTGENTIPWQPRDLPAGHYLFRCFFEKELLSGRIVVLQ
jgi:hypothetical protein